MNSRTRRFSFLTLIAFVGFQSADAAPPGKPSLVTTVEVVSKAMMQELPLSASTEALRDSSLSPRIEGLVEAVFVQEGDWVEAGQKLLSLDPTLAQLDVASARARVDEALALHKDARRQAAEFRSLKDRKHVAKTSLASAEAAEEATKAALASERAAIKRLQELLERHTLKAPFEGIVAQKSVEVGQWVKTDTSAIQLVALNKVRIRASVPQHHYSQIARDAKVRIVFDALPGQSFSGDLASLVAVANQSTRSFPVLIDLENPENLIAPGMSARVYVQLKGGESEALLVPRDAVVLKADGSRLVWRVQKQDEQTKVNPVTVSIGRAVGGQLEILDSSLKPGEQIILLGNESLRPGQSVVVR